MGEGFIEKGICGQRFEGSSGRAMRLNKGRDRVLGKGNSKRHGYWGHSRQCSSTGVESEGGQRGHGVKSSGLVAFIGALVPI